jgi:hypothetical protein
MISFQQEAIRVARKMADVVVVAGLVAVIAWAIAGFFG